MENPYVKGVLNGKFNLEDWMQNIPKSTMYLLTGNCGFNVDFEGLVRFNNENEWLNDLKKLADQKGILRGEEAKKYKDLKNDLAVIDATAETARRRAATSASKEKRNAASDLLRSIRRP